MKTVSNPYDVIIIGSGPGGYIAAIRAAQLGLKTAIVEREHLAGICSNWGCIPTKALLRSAEVMHLSTHAKNYGLKLEGSISPDLKAVVDRSRGIAQRMNAGVGFLMKKNKVDVIWGEAKLTKAASGAQPAEIVVGKSTKKPMEPQAPLPKTRWARAPTRPSTSSWQPARGPGRCPGIEPDGKLIWTYFEAMVPAAMPKSLLVVGSGAIGIEFASFYRMHRRRGHGGRTHGPTCMPVEDAEISAFARKAVREAGHQDHHSSAGVTKVAEEGRRFSVTATMSRCRTARPPSSRPTA
jgi:dihydrolipoamide dehydrogenase